MTSTAEQTAKRQIVRPARTIATCARTTPQTGTAKRNNADNGQNVCRKNSRVPKTGSKHTETQRGFQHGTLLFGVCVAFFTLSDSIAVAHRCD